MSWTDPKSNKILALCLVALIAGSSHYPDHAFAQARKTTAKPSKNVRQPSVKRVPVKQTTLTVTCNVRSAAITQDGIILGTSGNSFEVNPGRIVIDVAAPGFQTRRLAVTVKANVPNKIKVNLVKLAPKPKPNRVKPDQISQRRTQPGKTSNNTRTTAGRSAKPTSGGGAASLFDDDFAGLDQGPPISAPATRQVPQRRQPSRSRQPAPRYDSGGYGTDTYAQQPPNQYNPNPYNQNPYNQNNYGQQPATGPYGGGQPYQQPGYAPQYPGYGATPNYPQYPSYPQYQAPPTYVPYNPGYPSYPSQPAPYYYYPQAVTPPVVAAPIAPPMESVVTPPLSDAALPSVAEAPTQTAQLPEPDELVPRVAAPRKKTRSAPNPVIKFLPFGAGQYQRGSYMLGGLFTAAQGGALILYAMNSSNAAAAASNYAKAAASYEEAIQSNDNDAIDHYESEMTKQKTYGQSSDQNATLCLIGFAAAWAASTIEASINVPTKKSKKRKSRSRRKGLAFDTGIGQEGLEAHLSYNF